MKYPYATIYEPESNGMCHGSITYARCKLNNNWSYVVAIIPDWTEKFPDSRYITYTGKFNIVIGRDCVGSYFRYLYKDLKTRIATVEDAILCMKDDLKVHIANSRH